VVNVLGYGDRVASITTIAGPHAGTPLAQAILDTAPEFMDDLVDFLGWLLTEVYTESLEDPKVRAALTWCSEAHLATFQKDWPDDPAVARYSYAGRAGLFATGVPDCLGSEFPNPFEHHAVSAPMLGPWTLLGGGLGVANDGLVTVESAKWGEFLGCLPADHMQEIGLGLPQFYDHRTFYRKHAEFLVSRGH
jgi:triacylglycerol lipase